MTTMDPQISAIREIDHLVHKLNACPDDDPLSSLLKEQSAKVLGLARNPQVDSVSMREGLVEVITTALLLDENTAYIHQAARICAIWASKYTDRLNTNLFPDPQPTIDPEQELLNTQLRETLGTEQTEMDLEELERRTISMEEVAERTNAAYERIREEQAAEAEMLHDLESQISTDISAVSGRFSDIEAELEEVRAFQDDLQARFDKLQKEYDDLKSRAEDLEETIKRRQIFVALALKVISITSMVYSGAPLGKVLFMQMRDAGIDFAGRKLVHDPLARNLLCGMSKGSLGSKDIKTDLFKSGAKATFGNAMSLSKTGPVGTAASNVFNSAFMGETTVKEDVVNGALGVAGAKLSEGTGVQSNLTYKEKKGVTLTTAL